MKKDSTITTIPIIEIGTPISNFSKVKIYAKPVPNISVPITILMDNITIGRCFTLLSNFCSLIFFLLFYPFLNIDFLYF